MPTRVDINSWIHSQLDCEGGVVALDGFEDAFVGVVDRLGMDRPVACYDFDKCIQILCQRDQMSREDALDYFWANVAGSWLGEQTPYFLRGMNRE